MKIVGHLFLGHKGNLQALLDGTAPAQMPQGIGPDASGTFSAAPVGEPVDPWWEDFDDTFISAEQSATSAPAALGSGCSSAIMKGRIPILGPCSAIAYLNVSLPLALYRETESD